MKPFLIALFIACCIPVAVLSANYYVINAEGKIYVEGKLLKTGDKITEEAEIKFTSAGDKLYLLSPEKGNFLIQPEKKQDHSEPNWITLLKNALPESKYFRTASRGEEKSTLLFNDVYDLMGFFRDKVTYLPGTRFAVNTEKLPLDGNHYFRFAASTGTSPQAVPGIEVSQGSFILTGIDTTGMPVHLEMYYVQPGKNTLAGNFNLSVKSRKAISSELSLFFKLQENGGITPSQVYFEQVVPYVKEAYGNTHTGTIRDIIRQDLGIRVDFPD